MPTVGAPQHPTNSQNAHHSAFQCHGINDATIKPGRKIPWLTGDDVMFAQALTSRYEASRFISRRPF